MHANKVARGEDAGLLAAQHLAKRVGKLAGERIGVCGNHIVLSFFRGCQQRAVSSAESCLQISPDAIHRACRGPACVDVMDTALVQKLFDLPAKAGPLERLSKKVTPERLILQVLAKID